LTDILRKIYFAVKLKIDMYFSQTGRQYRDALARFEKWAAEDHVPIIKVPRLYDKQTVQKMPYYAPELNFATSIIIREKITRLVDVGSYVVWYPMISAVVDLETVDVRPTLPPMDMFKSRKGIITALPYPDESVQALSSLCVLEHVGLGRYGDPIGYNLDWDAALELGRVIMPGGHLILSTMLGRKSIQFDAGRVYDIESLLSMFPSFEISETMIYDMHTLEKMTEDEMYKMCSKDSAANALSRIFICIYFRKKEKKQTC
jgi:hypothetical protein